MSPSASNAGTVLIVEDEEHVRRVAAMLLEEGGFRVLSAKDGAEAVAVFREQQDVIDVVLLDLLMPNMDGREALDELRKISPDVRVVLTSGYGEEVATTSLDSKKLAGFLKKPYRLEALLEAIRRALPGRPS